MFVEYLEEDVSGKMRDEGNYCDSSSYSDAAFNGKQSALHSNSSDEEVSPTYVVPNNAEIRQAVVEMIILEERSFSFAESPGFVRVMEVACPTYECQTRFTVARDVLNLYKSEKIKLKELFRDSCQRFSITTDTWTSNQKLNYMSITAHFIDSEWTLQKRIINFCPISSHVGENIGKAVEECLVSWGIGDKLFTVTVDNASSNNTACAYLQSVVAKSGGISKGKYVHVRCIAHIINLIAWDVIGADQTSIDRIRHVVKYIRNSNTRYARLKELGKTYNVNPKVGLPQDCPTRWNSTYRMLSAACKYRRAIESISVPPSDKIDEQPPTEHDWEVVETLVEFLKEFYTLTTRISGALYLTSNIGLIEIAKTLKVLNDFKASPNERLKAMSIVMREKYDKYWGELEKMNIMVYLAMILDPHAKFTCVELILEDMFGVDKAKSIVNDVKKVAYEMFDEYRAMYSPQSGQSGDSSSSANQASGCETNYHRSLKERAKRMRGVNGNTRSEFERYLSEELSDEEERIETLAWWKMNGYRYPIVSRMARDILAIPLSTVASESAFSAEGRQVDQFRSSLNPMTVQALICTQDWIRSRSRTVIRKMEDNLEDLEELDEIEEQMMGVTLDDEDNVIFVET